MIGKLERDITQNPQMDWVLTFEKKEEIIDSSLIELFKEKSYDVTVFEESPLRIIIKNLTHGDNIDEALKIRRLIMNKGIFINIVLTPLEQFKMEFSEVVQFDDDSLHLSRVQYTKEEAVIKFNAFYQKVDCDILTLEKDVFESSIIYVNNDDYLWETGDSDKFLTWCTE